MKYSNLSMHHILVHKNQDIKKEIKQRYIRTQQYIQLNTTAKEIKQLYLGGPDQIKVRKGAKIRKPYNQAPHLTQNIDGKVTTSQLDIINESQKKPNSFDIEASLKTQTFTLPMAKFHKIYDKQDDF